MTEKYPETAHMFSEAKEAYNVVLGAMLGGYLALTISKNGVVGGKYIDLGICLIASCLFVLTINLVGDRFHRKLYKMASAYALWALFTAVLSVQSAGALGVDPLILVTIIVAWILMIAFEIASGAAALLWRQRND